MVTRKTFQYRIYPTDAQASRLKAWQDALRFLWNLAHEQRLLGLARPRDERRFFTAFQQQKQLRELRATLPWLADVPRDVCAQLLVDLDLAWQRYFKKLKNVPRWKSKHGRVPSLCEPHHKSWRFEGDTLVFPKLRIHVVMHRSLQGKPKTCRLVQDGDQWFACVVCEIDAPNPTIRRDPVVAIDRGVTNVIADSDGRLIQSPRFYEKTLRRLAHAQRVVARRQKGSKNQKKAKNRVMRLHRKVRRQREHFLHVETSRYAKSHGAVIVEKLEVRNMTRSARGTVEAPGKNVRAKSGLNRGILDSGWGAFARMLRYKLGWSGGCLIEVPAAYSSQTCSSCGAVDATSRQGERFCCTACGYVDHADLNAAKVLKSRANRSALPVEGSLMLGTLGSRKRVTLRVPRRSSESSGL